MFSATNDTSTHKRMVELAKDDKQLAARMNLLTHRVLEEFYDIEKDPDCLVNLIANPAYQHEIEKLRGSLERWLRDMQDPMLAALMGRQDPKVLAAYMLQQERAAQMRVKSDRDAWNRAIRDRLQKLGVPSKAKM
jgi:hypothetical protein